MLSLSDVYIYAANLPRATGNTFSNRIRLRITPRPLPSVICPSDSVNFSWNYSFRSTLYSLSTRKSPDTIPSAKCRCTPSVRQHTPGLRANPYFGGVRSKGPFLIHVTITRYTVELPENTQCTCTDRLLSSWSCFERNYVIDYTQSTVFGEGGWTFSNTHSVFNVSSLPLTTVVIIYE